MKQNIGTKDRIVRVIIGVILIILAIKGKSTLMALGGLFSLFEAFVSWCVFYQILGRNTCPIPNQKPSLDFKSTLFAGIKILIVAILLNIFANAIHFSTWYEFLNNPSKMLSWDNYIFLFIIYPFLLGLSALWKIPHIK